MQEIAPGVYLEESFPGVIVCAVVTKRGTILIDSPLRPEDGFEWKAKIEKISPTKRLLLVNLDSHQDRTLGNKAVEVRAVMHEEAARMLRERPVIFKGQNLGSGSEWEDYNELNGIRWLKPEITFSEHLGLNWGEDIIELEYHPGPNPGATWVKLPRHQIVFVGDAVMPGQPPYLKEADINQWLISLDILLSAKYNKYTVIGSRVGLAAVEDVREQKRYLKDIKKRLDKIVKLGVSPQTIEMHIPAILSAIEFPVERQEMYVQRLRQGLHHYFIRHYSQNIGKSN